MKLIYYYSINDNSPAIISKNLYFSLITRKELEFELIPFPYDSLLYEKKIKWEDLVFNQNDIFGVHITTSPFFAPTKRFILHVIAILRKIPIILNYHGDIQIETISQFKNRSWINFLKYVPSYLCAPFFLRNADIIIVNSYVMKNLLDDRYGIKSNVRVIPNALDDIWFSEMRSKINLKGSPSIFYHGRLSYEKGVDILLKGLVKSKQSEAILYIAGDGDQLSYLKSIVKENGIENNVKFLGKLSSDQLFLYMSSVNIAIYPSRYEAFSLAILEAFATLNGVVFFSNKAGINDFVNNMSFKLKSFTPNVDEIAKIIQNYSQEDNKELITLQKQFAEFFRWDLISNKYLLVYYELLKSQRL